MTHLFMLSTTISVLAVTLRYLWSSIWREVCVCVWWVGVWREVCVWWVGVVDGGSDACMDGSIYFVYSVHAFNVALLCIVLL